MGRSQGCILIVDDDKYNVAVLEKVLSRMGYIVLFGSNIVDLLEEASGRELRSVIRQAWIGTSARTSIRMIGRQTGPKVFEAKLTRIDLESRKIVLVLIWRSEAEGDDGGSYPCR